MSHKSKVLLHLPIFISPDALNGSTGRILAMLKYFHDRRDRLAVDAIVANQLGLQEWSEDLQQDVLRFVDNIFLYRGERNWFDFVYTRTQSFYHQRLLRQQLPVDSDYLAPPGYVDFCAKLLAQGNYNFVWINNLDYAHLASNLRSRDIQTVIDIHDITSIFRLVRKNITYSKNLKFDYEANLNREIDLRDRFHKVIVDSKSERDLLAEKLSPKKLHLIPSQVIGSERGAHLIPYQHRLFKYDVLFVGAENQPNREGLQFFLTDVLPLIVAQQPTVEMLIAGKISSIVDIDKALTENVTCLGYVPDLAEIYLKCRLVICPLQTGAGTKFKLVEAMAYGMPIVTTAYCASALSLVDGTNSFIANDPATYAQRVLQLIRHSELARSFSAAVSETFANEHSSSSIYSKLDRVLNISPPHLFD